MKMRTKNVLPALLAAVLWTGLGSGIGCGQAHAGPEVAGPGPAKHDGPQEPGGSVLRLVPLEAGAGSGVGVWKDFTTGDVLIRGNLQGRGSAADRKGRALEDQAGGAHDAHAAPALEED